MPWIYPLLFVRRMLSNPDFWEQNHHLREFTEYLHIWCFLQQPQSGLLLPCLLAWRQPGDLKWREKIKDKTLLQGEIGPPYVHISLKGLGLKPTVSGADPTSHLHLLCLKFLHFCIWPNMYNLSPRNWGEKREISIKPKYKSMLQTAMLSSKVLRNVFRHSQWNSGTFISKPWQGCRWKTPDVELSFWSPHCLHARLRSSAAAPRPSSKRKQVFSLPLPISYYPSLPKGWTALFSEGQILWQL